jgi:hypothetical protein
MALSAGSAIVLAAMLCGCSVAVSSPGPGRSGNSAAASGSAADAPDESSPSAPAYAWLPTPEVPTATPGESASPTPDCAATPSAFPSQPLPSLPAPATGKWTGLTWIVGPRSAPTARACDVTPFAAFGVFGWSRGYLTFRSSGSMTYERGGTTIAPASSVDGLRWKSGKALDTSDLSSVIYVDSVVEGPDGLLAVGRNQDAACGNPDLRIHALWASRDGISWTRLSMTALFGDGMPQAMAAGPSGYISTGSDGSGHGAVWMSSDGRTWKSASLTGSVFKDAGVDDTAATADGYVMAGKVLVPSPDNGCGSTPVYSPAIWWSADGAIWTRDTIAGDTPSETVGMSITKVGTHALVAVRMGVNPDGGQIVSTSAWTSADGRTWKLWPLTSVFLTSAACYGDRGLLIARPSDQTKTVAMDLIDAGGAGLITLSQTGNRPSDLSTAALGPAGLVVANGDGTQFWVGVPTGV